MRALWFIPFSIAIASCAPDTGVLVVIDAEGASAARARVLRLAAYEESGLQRLDRDLDDDDGGGLLPWRLFLTPRGGDASRRFELEAALVGEGDDLFTAIHVEGGFERGVLRQLSICFRDVCEGVLCGEDESCVEGVCAPVEAAPLSRLDEPACGDPECRGRQSGEVCAGGVCHGGGCCRGCWDGERCARGDSPAACGAGGAQCGACGAQELCLDGGCAPATVASFDVGSRHACAVLGRSVFCWGSGDAALGDAAAGPIRTPRRVILPGEDAWVQVATGDASCARSQAGAIVCWGGAYGAPRAALVLDPPAVYEDVAVGVGMVCGLRSDGALVCEGDNAWGQLGAGDVGAIEGPVVVQRAFWVGASGAVEERPDGPQRFVDVEAGREGAAARRADGTAFEWGRLARWNGAAYEDWAPPGPFLLSDATAWLDAGKTPRHHACVIDGAGVLACGGWSAHGEVGRAGEAWYPLEPIDASRRWRQVAAGAEIACAVAVDGSLWCWGGNDRAQLGGASALAEEPAPVRVGDRTDWIEVQAWHGGCGLADTLYCWGANEDGQSGTGQGAEVIVAPTPVAFGEP